MEIKLIYFANLIIHIKYNTAFQTMLQVFYRDLLRVNIDKCEDVGKHVSCK